jgi:hypothetical protein
VHPANALDLAFLAPGLVHQFGNLLLTIQGHALPGGASPGAGATAVLHACARGSASLRLFRHLLGGESGADPADAADTVERLAELLRIPVRERGHSVEVTTAGGARFAVDLAAMVPLVVAGTRALLGVVPANVAGTLVLGVRRDDLGEGIVLRFRPAPGGLPFPLPTDEAGRAVRAAASRLPGRHAVVATDDGLAIVQSRPTSEQA